MTNSYHPLRCNPSIQLTSIIFNREAILIVKDIKTYTDVSVTIFKKEDKEESNATLRCNGCSDINKSHEF